MADGASPDRASPAALGFRMPAEWEPHHATWIGWPHNASDWPGKIAPIPWVYGEIVRKLAPGEIVRILVNSAAHERRALRVLARVGADRSEEHTSELQSLAYLVCRLLLEKKKQPRHKDCARVRTA